MEKSDEAGGSSSKVPILTSVDMSPSEYKLTVEKLSVEMFNIHTSLTAANEKIARLNVENAELVNINEELGLNLVEFKTANQEVEYLKNKMVCAE